MRWFLAACFIVISYLAHAFNPPVVDLPSVLNNYGSATEGKAEESIQPADFFHSARIFTIRELGVNGTAGSYAPAGNTNLTRAVMTPTKLAVTESHSEEGAAQAHSLAQLIIEMDIGSAVAVTQSAINSEKEDITLSMAAVEFVSPTELSVSIEGNCGVIIVPAEIPADEEGVKALIQNNKIHCFGGLMEGIEVGEPGTKPFSCREFLAFRKHKQLQKKADFELALTMYEDTISTCMRKNSSQPFSEASIVKLECSSRVYLFTTGVSLHAYELVKLGQGCTSVDVFERLALVHQGRAPKEGAKTINLGVLGTAQTNDFEGSAKEFGLSELGPLRARYNSIPAQKTIEAINMGWLLPHYPKRSVSLIVVDVSI